MRSAQYLVHVRVLFFSPPPQVLSQESQEPQWENSGGPEKIMNAPLKVLNSHLFSLQVPTSSVSLEMRLTQYSVHVRVLVLFPPPQVLSQDDQERQGENSGGPENKSFRN